MNPDIAILSGSSGKLPNAAQTLVSTGTEDGDQPGAEAALRGPRRKQLRCATACDREQGGSEVGARLLSSNWDHSVNHSSSFRSKSLLWRCLSFCSYLEAGPDLTSDQDTGLYHLCEKELLWIYPLHCIKLKPWLSKM